MNVNLLIGIACLATSYINPYNKFMNFALGMANILIGMYGV